MESNSNAHRNKKRLFQKLSKALKDEKSFLEAKKSKEYASHNSFAM